MKKKKQKLTQKTRKNTQEEIREIGVKEVLCGLLLAVFPALAFFLYEFVFANDWMIQLPKLCMLLFFELAFFYIFVVSIKEEKSMYNIRTYLYHLTIAFVLAAIVSVLQTQYTSLLWLYFPICVVFTVFSNMQIAIGASVSLLFMQALMMDMQPITVVAEILVILIGVLLFENMETCSNLAMPVIVGGLFQAMLAMLVYTYLNHTLTFDAVLFAAIQLFVSGLFLALFLRLFCMFYLRKDFNRYQEINDPEYVLLTELKKRNPKEYYHAIHTAYFCEKIARKIGANEVLAKAGGYYHKIGKLRGNKNLKNILNIAEEHKFPDELLNLLKEYCGKNSEPRSKEVAIVIFADAMISSVTFLLEKDKNAKLEYDKIANVVFQKQMESGVLKHCNITMDELTMLQKTFVEENLYYDFLR